MDDVAHFVRRDRHVWHNCLHVVRQDGQWLVCDGLYNGTMLLTKDESTEDLHIAGQHSERDPSLSVIQDEQTRNLYSKLHGRTPRTLVILANGRPIDQSVSIAKFATFFASEDIAPTVSVHQSRVTAYFDPAIFPEMKMRGEIEYFDPKAWHQRRNSLHEGTSIVESSYLPDNSWDTQAALMRQVQSAIWKEAGAPAAYVDPRENLRLFCSLEFEKRSWAEQIDALLDVFKKTKTITKKLTIVLNGMTGTIFPDASAKLEELYAGIFKLEKEIAQTWRDALGDFVTIEFLGGKDLVSKVRASQSAHFFLAPAGTAALIALMANVKGVFYSHPRLHGHFANQLKGFPNGHLICRKTTREETGEHGGVMNYEWSGAAGQSYSISSEAFMAEVWPALTKRLSE
ncbi:hypothetical protein [Acidisoma silvae]|uniref:hypothetical protein n=1 Tax=Acidisoma silvae TaxID=2802396 RepID=UPI001D0BCD32|nr:hypothetical protein [Acidisoma silvae]